MKSAMALKEHFQNLTNSQKSVSELLNQINELQTKLEQQENKIEDLKRQAMEDPLTGVANRRCFESELKLTHAFYDRYQRNGALLLIDVDAFKGINDSLGHLAGDALLCHLAKILKNHVRTTDFVARLGGDEFCIILKEVRNEAEVLRKIEEINKAVSSIPCNVAGRDVYMSISMGYCLFGDAHSHDELVDKADRAMYTQKNNTFVADKA